jgi:hypothetical protein
LAESCFLFSTFIPRKDIYMKLKLTGLILLLALLLAACSKDTTPELTALMTVPLNSSHVGATGDTFGSVGTCPTPVGKEGYYGWHFIMPQNNNFTSLTVTFQNAGTFSADPFPGGVFVAHPDNSHAYIWTPTPDVLLSGSATSSGSNRFFNLSHVCLPVGVEHLTVSKTANTTYTRTHSWTIAKSVNPLELKLYTPGNPNGPSEGDATWTVDATYGGKTDSDHNVSGEVTIVNDGTLDAVITSVADVLAGTPISVDCAGHDFSVSPYTLAVGATLTCTYDQDGYVVGTNEATVTTEKDSYGASVDIIWGDPTTEINKTITIEDVSDLFGTVILGTATAPNDAQFTYDKHFAWGDYGRTNCGPKTYNNTATITETGQSASASLTVKVQCMIFQGDTAWAANGNTPGEKRYTTKGNWATYVQYVAGGKTTTLFAGQTMNAGTVNFSAVASGQVTITVTLASPWEFANVAENLKVQGYATAPSGNPSPGLFANKKQCNVALLSCTITVPAANFYGVHSDVGRWLPDPSF